MTLRSPFHNAHWKVPTSITLAFLAALALAIGHHAFYLHLDGKPVDSGARNFNQQVNIAIGTAFAFMIRGCLPLGVVVAYWQVFWQALLRQRKPLSLSQIDTLAGALGSLIDSMNVRAMWKHLALAAMALLLWLLPLAALLPPATLSVENTKHLEFAQLEVPTLNFSSASMILDSYQTLVGADGLYIEEAPGKYFYRWIVIAPSIGILHLTRSVAKRAQISKFPGIGVNMTSESQFPGSALRCISIRNEYLVRIRDALDRSCELYELEDDYGGWICGVSNSNVQYYSWLPHGTD